MKKHALIIEEYACWGCKACEAACKQENNPPDAADGIKYLSVWGDGPKLDEREARFPVACQRLQALR